MCTAATYQTKSFYFGRNLDLDHSYHETITVTPRNYPFHFREVKDLSHHYAMLGMAYVVGDYPLYYEATNEKGLSMAGLNFPENAVYLPFCRGMDNIAPFEFIPWILGQCAALSQVKTLLGRINLRNCHFSKELPLSPLHWIIASREGCLTVEPRKEGLKIYDNPVGVLTNEPPFDFQMTNLVHYMNLSPYPPVNHFCEKLDLSPYSLGMGTMGLPGSLSSSSRFVKAAFTKLNSCSGQSETESVSQFFHILGSVIQQRGCVNLGNGKYEITVYSSCCNADTGVYYYTTYENSQISAVDMHKENLEGCKPVSYPMLQNLNVHWQN